MPLLLVRHASAGSRQAWEGDDRERPLDPQGVAQSRRLVGILERFEIEAIYSSPYRRCAETMEPLAAARLLEVQLRAELGEEQQYEAGAELVRSLAERNVVVCGHGGLEARSSTTHRSGAREIPSSLTASSRSLRFCSVPSTLQGPWGFGSSREGVGFAWGSKHNSRARKLCSMRSARFGRGATGIGVGAGFRRCRLSGTMVPSSASSRSPPTSFGKARLGYQTLARAAFFSHAPVNRRTPEGQMTNAIRALVATAVLAAALVAHGHGLGRKPDHLQRPTRGRHRTKRSSSRPARSA